MSFYCRFHSAVFRRASKRLQNQLTFRNSSRILALKLSTRPFACVGNCTAMQRCGARFQVAQPFHPGHGRQFELVVYPGFLTKGRSAVICDDAKLF